MVIAGVIYELTTSRTESVVPMARLLPLFGTTVAFLLSCFWYVELGRRELQRNPLLLTLGLICAVVLLVAVPSTVQMLFTTAILHERVDDPAYDIFGKLIPILIFGFLSYRLSFERSKS